MQPNDIKTLRLIGEGTFGKVYSGILNGNKYAIKHIEYSTDELISIDALKEYSALINLSSPFIIKPTKITLTPAAAYFVMPLYDITLADYIKRDTTFEQKISIIGDLCKGLTHAHSRGFIHRDLKPANIMINIEKNNAVIIDWGASRTMAPMSEFTPRVITLWYRPIEILMGDVNYNSTVDIWSLGCVIYELFTGDYLFSGSSEINVMIKIFKKLGSIKRRADSDEKDSIANLFVDTPGVGISHTLLPQIIQNIVIDCLIYDKHKRPDIIALCRTHTILHSNVSRYYSIFDAVRACNTYNNVEPHYNFDDAIVKERNNTLAWVYEICIKHHCKIKTFLQCAYLFDLYISRDSSQMEQTAICIYYCVNLMEEYECVRWKSCIKQLCYRVNNRPDVVLDDYILATSKLFYDILESVKYNLADWTLVDYVLGDGIYDYPTRTHKRSLLCWGVLCMSMNPIFFNNTQERCAEIVIALVDSINSVEIFEQIERYLQNPNEPYKRLIVERFKHLDEYPKIHEKLNQTKLKRLSGKRHRN